MYKAVMLCLGLMLAGLPAQAQDQVAIEDVITQQLDAFKDRDVATAWTFASPMIRGMFGNPTNFGMMVQNGYPMVWDSTDVEFLDLRTEGGALIQRLSLRDAEGVRYVAEYQMIETPDGWQINGVTIVPAPDVGA
jgi:hypothetical protein